MNDDRQWQASLATEHVCLQPQEQLVHCTNPAHNLQDIGQQSERMFTWENEIGGHELKIDRRDKVAYSAYSNHHFHIALAIGALLAAVGLGWSFGATSLQFFGSNPATTSPKQKIAAGFQALDIATPSLDDGSAVANPNPQDSAPAPVKRDPNTTPSATRMATASTNRSPSTAKYNNVPSDPAIAAVRQRGQILHKPAPVPVPVPDTKPHTIEGWTILDVVGNTVILEGPGGVWRVTQGDTVPGVGRVGSIVRWGNRWLVSTTRGLISTR